MEANGNINGLSRLEQVQTSLCERLKWRETLYKVPINQLFELTGRPTVMYQLYDFSGQGPDYCRSLAGFLFKAFEQGQTPPSRLKDGGEIERREATIHEYLNWTITASPPEHENDLDFSGFRVVFLHSRFRPQFPPPNTFNKEQPNKNSEFGAPLPALPELLLDSMQPVAAATIRTGNNFIEIPFFATQPAKRSKGYGRSLLEAIEDIARGLEIKLLLLCSIDDDTIKNFWFHMGFQQTTQEDWKIFGVTKHDLLHMDNTVQLHKWLGNKRKWKSIILKHENYVQRLYYPQR
eukprot:TRINITY_DN2410_c0_g1_i14.p2 TRINITY_DN2410_c0_g1~~TRINITY_DN2410_c0_g1_i14.p2  ORF type:complete len:292 (+),score=26.69 TRINITY_DN2410_c0_g1_i14:263-1138(+)